MNEEHYRKAKDGIQRVCEEKINDLSLRMCFGCTKVDSLPAIAVHFYGGEITEEMKYRIKEILPPSYEVIDLFKGRTKFPVVPVYIN